MRRVVVTGMGIVCSIGNNKAEVVDSLKEGRSGIRRITRFDPSPFPTQFAGEADFDPKQFISFKQMKRMDRTCLPLLAMKTQSD